MVIHVDFWLTPVPRMSLRFLLFFTVPCGRAFTVNLTLRSKQHLCYKRVLNINPALRQNIAYGAYFILAFPWRVKFNCAIHSFWSMIPFPYDIYKPWVWGVIMQRSTCLAAAEDNASVPNFPNALPFAD